MFSWESQRNPYGLRATGHRADGAAAGGQFLPGGEQRRQAPSPSRTRSARRSTRLFPAIYSLQPVQPDRRTALEVVSAAQPDRCRVQLHFDRGRISTVTTALSPGATTGSTTRTASRCATVSASPAPMLPSAPALSASSIPLPTTTGILGGLNFTHIFTPGAADGVSFWPEPERHL